QGDLSRFAGRLSLWERPTREAHRVRVSIVANIATLTRRVSQFFEASPYRARGNITLDRAESPDAVQGRYRGAAIHKVGQIRYLRPQLQTLFFTNGECSTQRHIQLDVFRTQQIIDAQIAQRARSRIRKRCTCRKIGRRTTASDEL